MTQQAKRPPIEWIVTLPSHDPYGKVSFRAACRGNGDLGDMLNYFLYAASYEVKHNHADLSTGFITVKRTLDDIVDYLTISKKTATAYIRKLAEWEFVIPHGYHHCYDINFKKVDEAIANPPEADKPKPRGKYARCEDGKSTIPTIHEEDDTDSTDSKDKRISVLEEEIVNLQSQIVNLTSSIINLLSLPSFEDTPEETLRMILDPLKNKRIERDSFVGTSDDVSNPNTESDSFEKETICPECGELTADPQACSHNFPIGSTTPGEVHDPLPVIPGSTDDTESAAPPDEPVSVVEPLATGNLPSQESEHSANANTLHHLPDSRDGLPDTGTFKNTQEVESQGDDHAPSTGIDAPGDTLPGSGTDLLLGQGEPTLPEMEREQEADSTVTLEQNTPKPAESPLAVGAALTSTVGIQQVSTSQLHLIDEPPSTPGQHSGHSATSTPTGPDAAQVGQEECYTTPEDWEAARTLFQEEIRSRWAAWDRQQKQQHGGRWQTYEKQERLAWEILHPKPVDEALEQACRDIYTHLTTQWRGYEWDGKGARINEHKFIRCFVLKYRREFPDTVTLFEDIYTHLTTKHIKYSSDSYSTTVSASIIFHESNGVIQLWKKPKSQSNGHTPYTQNGHTKVTPIRSNALPTFTEADYEQLKRMPV